MNEVSLNGAIESDETFLLFSFKRHYKNFKLLRLARHRGTSVSRCGLSKEQVCIPCVINHNGLSMIRVSNLRKSKLTDLQKVLNDKIAKDSVFVTI